LLKPFLHILSLLWTNIKSLQAEKQVLETKVSGLQAEVNMLLARIAALQGQQNKNSRNSSKPPSTDKGRKKKVVKNSRSRSGKSTGAQRGNEGKTLHQVSSPKYVVEHKVDFCICEADLRNEPVQDVEKRQVFDMGELKIEVTEHQAEIKLCPECGKLIKGEFPEDVKAAVQYGGNVKAAIIDLNTQHFLSYERIQIFFKDWFNQPISGGLIYDSLQKGHQVLNGVYKERLVETLLDQKVLHTDETGLYFGGKRNWLHVLSTPKLTLLHPHESRGGPAIEDMGVLPVFTGRVIHDNYSSYPGYDNCKHGLCNAHHLRELLFFEEEQKAIWAMHLGIFLRSVKMHVDLLKQQAKTCMSEQDLESYQKRYHQILQSGYEHLPPPPPPRPNARGRPPKHPQHNFLNRMADKQDQVLAFMKDFEVPFDNNQAERDLRMVKTKQKVSGCFRSKKGAQAFAGIRGYISTVKKNSISVLDALTNLCKGKPNMAFLNTPE
jgi:transposase